MENLVTILTEDSMSDNEKVKDTINQLSQIDYHQDPVSWKKLLVEIELIYYYEVEDY